MKQPESRPCNSNNRRWQLTPVPHCPRCLRLYVSIAAELGLTDSPVDADGQPLPLPKHMAWRLPAILT